MDAVRRYNVVVIVCAHAYNYEATFSKSIDRMEIHPQIHRGIVE